MRTVASRRPAAELADEHDRAAAERRAGERAVVLQRAGGGRRDRPGHAGDRERMRDRPPDARDGAGELVGVLQLVLGDRRAAGRAEHERARQPAGAVPPALGQLQAPAERGQLGQRQVRVDDLGVRLHDVDVAAGGDELEDRAAGLPAPQVPARDRPVRVRRAGQVGRGADRDRRDLRQPLAVEGPHAARPRARRVHEEVARPVEDDERRAELLGQRRPRRGSSTRPRGTSPCRSCSRRRPSPSAARPSGRGSRSTARCGGA